jgi:arylsulfatase A-like enzyme
MRVRHTIRTAIGLAQGAVLAASAQAGDGFFQAKKTADYLEPAIPRPEQQKEVAEKLEALQARAGRKPNIIILVIDDLGYGDLGCYGGGEAVGSPTPNIDRLAREGLRLTSAYSQPTCTPTRAALMTGRLPCRTGLIRPILAGDPIRVNPWSGEVTAAKILSDNGYRTALSGKWHLGEGDGMRPHEVGYDEFYGFLGVVSDYTAYVDARKYGPLMYKPERLAVFHGLGATEFIVEGKKGGEMKKVKPLATAEDVSKCDQEFAEWSTGFIKRSVAEGKPFYLVHAFSKVHKDNWPSKAYEGKSPAATPYRDSVVEVDDIVGRLMNVVEEEGQKENTFVFVTSDNGPNGDVFPDSGYTPFRGGKGTTWEGGVRTPGIAYWPGMIKPGRVSDGLFDLMDLFNTSLGIAGIADEIPSGRYVDGIDQTSFLLADAGETKREAVYMWSEYDLMALRTAEFKAHLKIMKYDRPKGGLSQVTVSDVGLAPWTYDLYVDPKEEFSEGVNSLEWVLPILTREGLRHEATFAKYPVKVVGLQKPTGGQSQ